MTRNVEENIYCNICTNEIKKGEYKRTLNNCKHYFHKKCFDRYMLKININNFADHICYNC